MVLLIYFLGRSIFVLVCYTKVEIEYFERLVQRLRDMEEYNLDNVDKNKVSFSIVFRVSLFRLFFFFCFIWRDKNFKEFFTILQAPMKDFYFDCSQKITFQGNVNFTAHKNNQIYKH
jgi:hypothetical protein